MFHHALPKYLKVELERIQKRALVLAIICPSTAYNDALDFLGIPKITTYNEAVCDNMFDAIVKDYLSICSVYLYNCVHFKSSTTLDEICIYCFFLWLAINYLRRIIPRYSLTGIMSSFLYLDRVKQTRPQNCVLLSVI